MHNAESITWVCAYVKDGAEYCVNLTGTSEEAVLINNLQAYPGLNVLGKLVATIPAPEFD